MAVKKSIRICQAAAAVFCAAAGITFGRLNPAAATDWPQSHSDVRADPAVLFGTLPNGMRYAIMHNAAPKNAVAMRLCIEAGSAQESDAQQGLAHFLEHMAFRGSRHIPENQVWPGLQRLGMGIGADANAATDFTQTVYQFNLPKNDSQSIDGGLMMLRDIASELDLAQSAMDAERGVILSEERLRDTPDFRTLKLVIQQALPGSAEAARFPIGKPDVIRNAPVSLIRDFYNAYYRPDRATLIVIGDIDPKLIQAKIASRFSDWKPVGPPGTDPVDPPIGPRLPQVDLVVDAGDSGGLALDLVSPAAPDTRAQEQTNLIDNVGLLILAYRLQALANGPEHPFSQAQPTNQRFSPRAYFHLMLLDTQPQDWHRALDAAVTNVRRLLKDGVTADEVTRATNDLDAQLQKAAAGVSTRSSRDLADRLATAVNNGDVFESPVDELTIADETFKDLSVARVNAALREMMADHGPLLLLKSPAPIEGGQAAVTAAMTAAEAAPLTAPTTDAHVVWPYTNFGPPGQVVEEKTIADLQTTLVRFANGVRLTVKPTTFTAGQILVNVDVGDGRLGLPTDHVPPTWAFEHGGFVFGGLKAIDFNDMLRALTGRSYDVRTEVGDNGFSLSGPTRPADLATELQVLAAYVSAPGWRSDALDRARSDETGRLIEANGSPEGVFQRDISSLLRSGDPRWAWPSAAEVEALKPADFKTMLEAQLASARLDLTVVGDVTADRAIKEVAASFGALPPRVDAPPSKFAAASSISFPAGAPTPVVLHHHGRADQGIAVIAWPTTDVFDLKAQASLEVLKNVFASRLMDQLRIRDGVTYSPQTMLNASKVLPGYGYFLAATELPSAKMPLFFDVTDAVAADLRAHPISEDELNRARNPKFEEVVDQMQTNDYWFNALAGVQSDPRLFDVIRAAVPDLSHVTSADVQQAAEKYLVDITAWKAEITPEKLAGGH
jgi:zinc protease